MLDIDPDSDASFSNLVSPLRQFILLHVNPLFPAFLGGCFIELSWLLDFLSLKVLD